MADEPVNPWALLLPDLDLSIKVPWLCPDCDGYGAEDFPTNPTICGGLMCWQCDGVCPTGHKDAPTLEQVLLDGEKLIEARREGGGLFVKAKCDDSVDW